MVRFASLFNLAERTVTFLSGKQYSLDTLRSLGAGELLNSMCEFSEKLAALRLNEDELSLFTAVVLVSAGKIYVFTFVIKRRAQIVVFRASFRSDLLGLLKVLQCLLQYISMHQM